ncbi:TIGR03986 family type III CRISPR-associated RAMP protein [Clostridium polynesiense]|uniref:TIGR03986 family type III CRISPR-associated RAMP protein n=1 Tax=Clostridium polynesiense TaxID=1325933 RepID=UPI00058D982C|nr:TIGR03986 family CRISPR-associated RAMP protein [Clostridium polynesiense]
MAMKDYSFVKDYSVAPYNFVSLPRQCVFPYKTHEELPGHGELTEDLLNGYIEYTIENETPIIVGSTEKDKNNQRGKKENPITFFKNPQGEYTIPGNTLRGFMRNNIAVLSLSSLKNYITNDQFYFRSFGKGKSQKDYKDRLNIDTVIIDGKSFSRPKNVKGGYIYKGYDGEYYIVPPKKIKGSENTYFVISEPYLRKINPKVDVKYMYTEKILELINNKEKYMGKEKEGLKKRFLKCIKDNFFKPYCIRVSFKVANSRRITHIGSPGEYENQGYLMTSKFIQGKLAHYIIPEPDFETNKGFSSPGEKVDNSFIDYYNDELLRTKKRKTPERITEGKDDTYFFLPEKKGKEKGKPLFFAEYEDKTYLGFSPYLRISYDNSVWDLIPPGYDITKSFSYLDALMGFTGRGDKGKLNYKSRLSFKDAVCVKGAEEDKTYRLVAGEPHASAYPLYLEQIKNAGSKEIKNYNDAGNIRGLKHYLIKSYLDDEYTGNKENVAVYIKPLKTKANFLGQIHFKNLSKEELGLVLWALKVKENAYENIGYGKPYGFGRIRIDDIKVYYEDLKAKYSAMNNSYLLSGDVKELISSYISSFKSKFNINIEEHPSVRDLMILKTLVVEDKNKNNGRYMMIKFDSGDSKNKGDNEFNKLLPLPNPQELLKIINNNTISKSSGNDQNQRSNTHPQAGNYQNKDNSSKTGNSGKEIRGRDNYRENYNRDNNSKEPFNNAFAEAFKEADKKKKGNR